MWLQIAFFVASLLISAKQRPKIPNPRQRPTGIQEFQKPTSESGREIPVLFGTKRIKSPNVLWFGDQSARPGDGADGVVFYWAGLHLGLCAGPIDDLLQIDFANKTLWHWGETGASLKETGHYVNLNKPELLGGVQKDGGFVGMIEFLPGGPWQGKAPYLQSMVGDSVPAYRGVASILVHKSYIGTRPYLPEFAFTVRRRRHTSSEGARIWYLEKCEIGNDMNPAHILYECITDPVFGMGYSAADIDDAAFRAAADTLHAENMGMSMLWDKTSKIEDFIETVVSHIDGILYVDTKTGLFKLTLVREDNNFANRKKLDETNVLKITNFKRPSVGELISAVSVKYSAGESDTVRVTTVHNLALMDQIGIVASTRDYTGFTDEGNARRAAERDLRALSTPLASCTIYCNRKASDINIGQIFDLSWPRDGIGNLTMRAVNIEYGTLENGMIKIMAVQDAFSFKSQLFTKPVDKWDEEQKRVTDIAYPILFELPFAEPNFSKWNQGMSQIAALASKRAGGNLTETKFKLIDTASPDQTQAILRYATTTEIVDPVKPWDTKITIPGGIDFRRSERYPRLALLGNEIVACTSEFTTTTPTIERGCYDTMPKEWPAGTKLHIFHESSDYERFESIIAKSNANPNYRYNFKFVPMSDHHQYIYDAQNNPIVSITTNNRYARPRPPKFVEINSMLFPETVSDSKELTISWHNIGRLAFYGTHTFFLQYQGNQVESNYYVDLTLYLGKQTDAPFRFSSRLTRNSEIFQLPDFRLARGTWITVKVESYFMNGNARLNCWEPYVWSFQTGETDKAAGYITDSSGSNPAPTPNPGQPSQPGQPGGPVLSTDTYATEAIKLEILSLSAGLNETKPVVWDKSVYDNTLQNGDDGQTKEATLQLGGYLKIGNIVSQRRNWWAQAYRDDAAFNDHLDKWQNNVWPSISFYPNNLFGYPDDGLKISVRNPVIYALYKGSDKWEIAHELKAENFAVNCMYPDGKYISNYTHTVTDAATNEITFKLPKPLPDSKIAYKAVTVFSNAIVNGQNLEGLMFVVEVKYDASSRDLLAASVAIDASYLTDEALNGTDYNAATGRGGWHIGVGVGKLVKVTKEYSLVAFFNSAEIREAIDVRAISRRRFMQTNIPWKGNAGGQRILEAPKPAPRPVPVPVPTPQPAPLPQPRPNPNPGGGGVSPQPQPQPRPNPQPQPQPQPRPPVISQWMSDSEKERVIRLANGMNDARPTGWVANGNINKEGQYKSAAVVQGIQRMWEPSDNWWNLPWPDEGPIKNYGLLNAKKSTPFETFQNWTVGMEDTGNTARNGEMFMDLRNMCIFFLYEGSDDWWLFDKNDYVGWASRFNWNMSNSGGGDLPHVNHNGFCRVPIPVGNTDRTGIYHGGTGDLDMARAYARGTIRGILVTAEARISPNSPAGARAAFQMGGDWKWKNDGAILAWYPGFGLSATTKLSREWQRFYHCALRRDDGSNKPDVSRLSRAMTISAFRRTRIPLPDMGAPAVQPGQPSPQPQPQPGGNPGAAGTFGALSNGVAINAVQIKVMANAGNNNVYRIKFVVVRNGIVLDDNEVSTSYQNLVAEREWSGFKQFPYFENSGDADGANISNVQVKYASLNRAPIGTVAPWTEANVHADNMRLVQNAPQPQPPAPIPQPQPPAPGPSPQPQPGTAAGTFGAITPKATRNIVWIKNTSNAGIDGFKTITFKVIDENSNVVDDWKVQSEMNSLVAERSRTNKYYAIVQTNGELPDNIANRTYTEVTINGADVTNTDPYYWSTIHKDKLVGANFAESVVRGSGGVSSPSPAPAPGPSQGDDGGLRQATFGDIQPGFSRANFWPRSFADSIGDWRNSQMLWIKRFATDADPVYLTKIISVRNGVVISDDAAEQDQARKDWDAQNDGKPLNNIMMIVDQQTDKPENLSLMSAYVSFGSVKANAMNNPQPYYDQAIHKTNMDVNFLFYAGSGGGNPVQPSPAPTPQPAPQPSPGPSYSGGGDAAYSFDAGATYGRVLDTYGLPNVNIPAVSAQPGSAPNVATAGGASPNLRGQALTIGVERPSKQLTTQFWAFGSNPQTNYGQWDVNTYFVGRGNGGGTNSLANYWNSQPNRTNVMNFAKGLLGTMQSPSVTTLALWPIGYSCGPMYAVRSGRATPHAYQQVLKVARLGHRSWVCSSSLKQGDGVSGILMTDGRSYSGVFVNDSSVTKEIQAVIPALGSGGSHRRTFGTCYVASFESGAMNQSETNVHVEQMHPEFWTSSNGSIGQIQIPPYSVMSVIFN